APANKVKDICALLACINSPTVLPLSTEGWMSIHTVVDQKHFWEIVNQLKTAGAEGILVLPIEKMIL
ncbi:MAG: ATP phosphoribosyltransferase, partial [Prevotella sp.]|nr:ATP phosphoribosyltransferase [Prevotella sp.]